VRLVDHVAGAESVTRVQFCLDQFVENQEQLVRIDRARIEIVVTIFAVVEMEPAQLAEAVQPRDDLLDVGVGRVMADVSLDLIGASGALVVEGRFAASELFTRALAALRPDALVLTPSAESDVSFGALRLIAPDLAPPGELAPVAPLDRDLSPYRAEWHDDIEVFR
jgi:hypothetical protein